MAKCCGNTSGVRNRSPDARTGARVRPAPWHRQRIRPTRRDSLSGRRDSGRSGARQLVVARAFARYFFTDAWRPRCARSARMPPRRRKNFVRARETLAGARPSRATIPARSYRPGARDAHEQRQACARADAVPGLVAEIGDRGRTKAVRERRARGAACSPRGRAGQSFRSATTPGRLKTTGIEAATCPLPAAATFPRFAGEGFSFQAAARP